MTDLVPSIQQDSNTEVVQQSPALVGAAPLGNENKDAELAFTLPRDDQQRLVKELKQYDFSKGPVELGLDRQRSLLRLTIDMKASYE